MSTATETLSGHGVAIWLDDLSRARLETGTLAEMMIDQHVVGVTTNPSIFQAAITGSDDYVDDIARLAAEGANADAIVRRLTVDDVRRACELFTPVWQSTGGQDGRVSIEVDPRLARDTEATIIHAAELWDEVDRPNLLVKIPGTEAGLPAIRATIAAGISVNVTLLFSVSRYRQVMDAYHAGLEDRLTAGHPIDDIHSVASFFVSRVDAAVGALLAEDGTEQATALQGTAAIANARLAYAAFLEQTASPGWQALERSGANPQRPLWASTGVKNPAYPPTMYVSELVAPGTVNTMPEATLTALSETDPVTGDTITANLDHARDTLEALAKAGIDRDHVTAQLETDGITKFEQAWRQLLDTIDTDRAASAPTAG
jgi:transaldolase